jgi:hypothetical protein
MIEVHHVRRKASTTVSARHPPQRVEELRRGTLAVLDALDLCLSVRRVVPNVVRALLSPNHGKV